MIATPKPTPTPPTFWECYMVAISASVDRPALLEFLTDLLKPTAETADEWKQALERNDSLKLIVGPKDLTETRAAQTAHLLQTWAVHAHDCFTHTSPIFQLGIKNV